MNWRCWPILWCSGIFAVLNVLLIAYYVCIPTPLSAALFRCGAAAPRFAARCRGAGDPARTDADHRAIGQSRPRAAHPDRPGGGFAEHRFRQVRSTQLGSDYPGPFDETTRVPDVTTVWHEAPCDGPYLRIALPPTSQITLELTMDLHVGMPTYAPPWSQAEEH